VHFPADLCKIPQLLHGILALPDGGAKAFWRMCAKGLAAKLRAFVVPPDTPAGTVGAVKVSRNRSFVLASSNLAGCRWGAGAPLAASEQPGHVPTF